MSTQQICRMAIWLVPLGIQPVIALAMIVRKQATEFPVFLSYTLFVAARDLCLLFVRRNAQLYSSIYWIGEPITIIVGVAAIYEVLWHLIRPHPTLRLLGIRVFWGSISVATLGSLVMLRASRFSQIPVSFESVVLLERSARFAQVAVLIAFIFLVSSFGLTWKHHTSGIVLGFGLAAGFQLASLELKSLHLLSDALFSSLSPSTYSLSVLVWAFYFIPRQKSRPVMNQFPEMTDIAKWDRLLDAYLHR
jgi:hypothetical protein